MTNTFKIVFVTDPVTITRKDGSTCLKQLITLRELGGKFADQYVTTYFSEKPCTLSEGTTISASLRFGVRTYEGQDYQDITLQEYVVMALSSPPKLPTIPTI